MRRILLTALAGFAFSMPASAQNTGGVFGPVVKEGHASAEYRFTYAASDNGRGDAGAHRFHYQQAVNSDVMWRVVGQASTNRRDHLDFDYVQAELFWELSSDVDRWKRGFRFDARLRDAGRPHQIGVNFTNEFTLAERLKARVIGLTTVQLGQDAADGVALQSRATIFYKTKDGVTFGAESFNSYGTLGDFRDFDDSTHQTGPFAILSVGERWGLYGGLLFGASRAARDTEFRMRISRGL